MQSTFFVPGFTARRYPDTVRRIVAAGHEVGWHNDMHEPPYVLSEGEERAIIGRSREVLEPLTGTPPVGYRAPSWELNERTPELLAAAGFVYDASLMDDDVPYRLGTAAGTLIELPVHWSLDDWEQYAFLPEPDIGQQIEPPSKVLEAVDRGARRDARRRLLAGDYDAPLPIRSPGAGGDGRRVPGAGSRSWRCLARSW